MCTNSGNGRLKGVRIFGARVPRNGTIEAQEAMREAKMGNCAANEWRNPVHCPDGQVAEGLLVYRQRRSGVAGLQGETKITGLGLRCGEVAGGTGAEPGL